jgi:hypothetical protein
MDGGGGAGAGARRPAFLHPVHQLLSLKGFSKKSKAPRFRCPPPSARRRGRSGRSPAGAAPGRARPAGRTRATPFMAGMRTSSSTQSPSASNLPASSVLQELGAAIVGRRGDGARLRQPGKRVAHHFLIIDDVQHPCLKMVGGVLGKPVSPRCGHHAGSAASAARVLNMVPALRIVRGASACRHGIRWRCGRCSGPCPCLRPWSKRRARTAARPRRPGMPWPWSITATATWAPRPDRARPRCAARAAPATRWPSIRWRCA